VSTVESGEVVLRLLAAAALGGLPGWDREERGKDAGIRTHMLLALGSAVFALVSVGAFTIEDLRDAPAGVTVDPVRVASYVAEGVGFVGTGAILRREGTVHGLTTAASLWVASAVGLAAGTGEAARVGGLPCVIGGRRSPGRPPRQRSCHRRGRPRP
jgi:putative Mg2+ transporter-C (MgtC) family protein